MLNTFNERKQELKTPVRVSSYTLGLEDYGNEALNELKRLRRRTKHWKGVNMAINIISKINQNK